MQDIATVQKVNVNVNVNSDKNSKTAAAVSQVKKGKIQSVISGLYNKVKKM